MKLNVVLAVFLLAAGLAMYAGNVTAQMEKTKERIGVYDSRAIAVAFVGSESFSKWMSDLMVKLEKAKAAGDHERVAELEKEGKERQKLIHKQGFSTAPVDNILEQIKDRLPAVNEKAGVDLLVSKWDNEALEKHSSAERVDVTMALIDAIHPTERQRSSAIAIQKHEPIPLEKADKIKD
jgi:hypothetical protein